MLYQEGLPIYWLAYNKVKVSRCIGKAKSAIHFYEGYLFVCVLQLYETAPGHSNTDSRETDGGGVILLGGGGRDC